MKTFKEREFESENDFMFTFKGFNNSFCIMFNSKCISTSKTIKTHNKHIEELIKKHNLTETNN